MIIANILEQPYMLFRDFFTHVYTVAVSRAAATDDITDEILTQFDEMDAWQEEYQDGEVGEGGGSIIVPPFARWEEIVAEAAGRSGVRITGYKQQTRWFAKPSDLKLIIIMEGKEEQIDRFKEYLGSAAMIAVERANEWIDALHEN